MNNIINTILIDNYIIIISITYNKQKFFKKKKKNFFYLPLKCRCPFPVLLEISCPFLYRSMSFPCVEMSVVSWVDVRFLGRCCSWVDVVSWDVVFQVDIEEYLILYILCFVEHDYRYLPWRFRNFLEKLKNRVYRVWCLRLLMA